MLTGNSASPSAGEDDDNVQLARVSVSAGQVVVEPVPLRRGGELSVERVACSATHALFLTGGRVFALGDNTHGQLGAATERASSSSPSSSAAFFPVELPGPVGSIAVGPTFSAASTLREGKLFVWGRVGAGNETLLASANPSLVTSAEPVATIAAGTHFVAALNLASRTKVLCFGSNAEWSIPSGRDKKAAARTCDVALDCGGPISSLQAYGSLTCVLTGKGECYAWGGKKRHRAPTLVAVPPKTTAVAVSSAYMVAVTEEGELFRRSGVFSKGEFASFGPPAVQAANRLGGGLMCFVGDEHVLVQMRASGKVALAACKTGDVMQAPTVRVCDMSAWAGEGALLALAVPNTRGRIFSALHPEPLLKYATAKDYVKWLVRTGCRFPSDVNAFEFALETVLKLVAPLARVGSSAGGKVGYGGGIAGLIKLLRKTYKPGDVSCQGVRRLLEILLRAPSTRPSDARAALTEAGSFLEQADLAYLWNVENGKAAPAQPGALPPPLPLSSDLSSSSSGGVGAGGAAAGAAADAAPLLELDEVAGMAPKAVAQALSFLRRQQLVALSAADMVRFAMISPDPMSFELFPAVAEYVDFGNTLGRWGKELVCKGSSKAGRGARIRWLYQLLLELETLRNFDLCFHLSGALLWELLPDIAKQSGVNLENMMPVVKKFGDRKFWNGAYAAKVAEDQAIIPLLVYHSNLVSGGSGGTESVVERAGQKFLNISKFRAISDQLQLLRRLVEKCAQQQQSFANAADVGAPLLEYFQHLQVLPDAALTVLRSQIVPLSRFREGAKVTSLEGFAADVIASVSAVDRRVSKWRQLVRLLESDAESVRLRAAPFLVSPRDAVVEGNLLGPVVRALVLKIPDVAPLSPPYWLLRRIVASVSSKPQFEDLVLALAAVLAAAVESLPQATEPVLAAFCDFAAGKAGATLVSVVRALQALQETAKAALPDLERDHAACREQLEKLQREDGALQKAKALAVISSHSGLDDHQGNAAVRKVTEKRGTVAESVKLQSAKLEHYALQRDSLNLVQSSLRDFAVLVDAWNATINAGLHVPRRYEHNLQAQYHYFLVRYSGKAWAEGAGESYVHHEPDGLSRAEFQEKLAALYEPVLGRQLSFGVAKGDCNVEFVPVRRQANGATFVTEVSDAAGGARQRLTLSVDYLPNKRRFRVVSEASAPLAGGEDVIEELQSVQGALADEAGNLGRLRALVAKATQSSGSPWVAQAVRGAQLGDAAVSAAVYDYLHAVREALARLSVEEEEDEAVRAHVALSNAFEALLLQVVPALGPPTPVAATSKPLFAHRMLHQFVAWKQSKDDTLRVTSPGRGGTPSMHRRRDSKPVTVAPSPVLTRSSGASLRRDSVGPSSSGPPPQPPAAAAAAAEAKPAARACHKCRASLDPGHRFCIECGEPVPAGRVVVVPAAAAQQQVVEVMTPDEEKWHKLQSTLTNSPKAGRAVPPPPAAGTPGGGTPSKQRPEPGAGVAVSNPGRFSHRMHLTKEQAEALANEALAGK